MNTSAEGPDTLQRISKAAVEELRRKTKDLTMTTGKVSRAVIDALRQTGVTDTVEKVKDIHTSVKTSEGIVKRVVMQFVSLKGWDKK